MKKSTCVSLEEDAIKKIDSISKDLGRSRSHMVNEAIQEFCRRWEDRKSEKE